MPLILDVVTFANNTLKTNGTTSAKLKPADAGDDFAATLCVKVVDQRNPARYWGGRLKEVAGGRVWRANLRYLADKCADHPDLTDSDDDKGDPKPVDTTDVSVTIVNPTTGDASTVPTRNVTVLP